MSKRRSPIDRVGLEEVRSETRVTEQSLTPHVMATIFHDAIAGRIDHKKPGQEGHCSPANFFGRPRGSGVYCMATRGLRSMAQRCRKEGEVVNEKELHALCVP
jgi:hypothetical protein